MQAKQSLIQILTNSFNHTGTNVTLVGYEHILSLHIQGSSSTITKPQEAALRTELSIKSDMSNCRQQSHIIKHNIGVV